MDLFESYRKELNEAYTSFNVDELYAFGSVLTSVFNANRDLDFMVTISSIDPLEYAENYFALEFELERIFNRKIDLLEQKAIKNKPFASAVNKKKMLVYARRNQGLA